MNITLPQIFWIDIEWLGVGNVRCGFIIDGKYYICHTFRHANVTNESSIYGTYMTSARLAPRYEISFLGTGNSHQYKLKQICSTVISEGGYEGKSIVRHINTNLTSALEVNTNGIMTPVIALKLNDKSGTSGYIGINGIVIPSQLSILFDSAKNCFYQILLNPVITPSIDASFNTYQSLNTDDKTSVVSIWINPSGTAYNVSGGIIINSGFIQGGGTENLTSPTDFNLQIGRNIYIDNPNLYKSDVIVLACSIFGSGGNTSNKLYAQLGWYEL